MKRILTLCVLFLTLSSNAQDLRLELQLGGSNFLGMTINTEPLVRINEQNAIGIKLGVGPMIPGWVEEPTLSVLGGLNYYWRRFGIGMDVSGFTGSPFQFSYYGYNPDIDLIAYPNVSYTHDFNSGLYLRGSVGVWLAYDWYGYYGDEVKLQWAGDPIPGISLCVGYSFDVKKR